MGFPSPITAEIGVMEGAKFAGEVIGIPVEGPMKIEVGAEVKCGFGLMFGTKSESKNLDWESRTPRIHGFGFEAEGRRKTISPDIEGEVNAKNTDEGTHVVAGIEGEEFSIDFHIVE